MAIDLPHDIPMACLFEAAVDYQLPPSLLYAIRKVEGGTLGRSNGNTNGTRDYGPMQINTVWVRQFYRNEGVTAEIIASHPCIAVRGAAYVLRYEINRVGDFWRGVGNYHSRDPQRNENYRMRVHRYAVKFDEALRRRGLIP